MNCQHVFTEHWIMEPQGGKARRYVRLCRKCGTTAESFGPINVRLWNTLSSLGMQISHEVANVGRNIFARKGPRP